MGERTLTVMDEYQDLVCKECGKVNEKAAFARGIQPEVVIKSKRPFLGSLDSFFLLDERSKDEFTRLLPGELGYFRIPSSGYYVASAKAWLEPEEGHPGFEFVRGLCKGCGRSREVIWAKARPLTIRDGKVVTVPPLIHESKPFIAVNLEGPMGARETWLVSEEVANELGAVRPPLTGMVISSKEIDDGRPVP